jgi:hypothetical protein
MSAYIVERANGRLIAPYNQQRQARNLGNDVVTYTQKLRSMANQLPAARKNSFGIQRGHARIGVKPCRQRQCVIERLRRQCSGSK